jgi:glycosyltransferase involved in cell wall biosynthesis
MRAEDAVKVVQMHSRDPRSAARGMQRTTAADHWAWVHPPDAKPADSPALAAGRVAVVIPTYNYADFLEAALESVYAQTVAPAEIIVVDDGSEDDPAAAVAGHPGVRLLRHAHLGLGAARNTGWRATDCEFVIFLDADDRLRPEAIALNLEQFAARPECGLVYGAYAIMKLATGFVEPVEFETPGFDPVVGFLSGNRIGMHGAVMYRREVLETLGGFDADLPACEDYDLYIRAVLRFPMACRPEVLADYVRHDRNMSLDAGMMLEAALGVLRRYEPFARKKPEWMQALRDGEAGLIGTYAADWANAYLWALGTREQFELSRQGLKIASIAPRVMAGLLVDPILSGVLRRLGRRLGWRRAR